MVGLTNNNSLPISNATLAALLIRPLFQMKRFEGRCGRREAERERECGRGRGNERGSAYEQIIGLSQ